MKKQDIEKQTVKAIQDNLDDTNIVRLLSRITSPHTNRGSFDLLVKIARRELKRYKAPRDKAVVRLVIARGLQSLDRLDQAKKELEKVASLEELDYDVLAYANVMLAIGSFKSLDYPAAEVYCKKALAYTGREDGHLFAMVIGTIANVHSYQGRHSLALEYNRSYREVCENMGDKLMIFNAINNLANSYENLGKIEEARVLYEDAYGRAMETESNLGRAIALVNMGNYHFVKLGFFEAVRMYRESLEFSKKVGHNELVAFTQSRLALAFLDLGETDEAIRSAREALAVTETAGVKRTLGDSHHAIARALVGAEPEEAKKHYLKSIEYYREIMPDGNPQGVEFALLEFGELLDLLDQEGWEDYVSKALDVLAERPDTPLVKKAVARARKLLAEKRPDYLLVLGEDRKKTLEARNANMKKILEISRAITSENDFERSLELVVDAAVEASGAERGVFAIKNGGGVRYSITRNFAGGIENDEDFETIDRVVTHAARRRKPLLSGDVRNNPGFRRVAGKAPEAVRAAFVFPLVIKKKVIGAVYLDSRFAAVELSAEEKDVLLALMEQAAIIIDKIRLLDEVGRLNAELEKKVEIQGDELTATRSELLQKQAELESRFSYRSIIGRSAPMQELYRRLEQYSKSEFPVLIYGQSGTGKELVARAIHYNSPRKNNHFVAINCAAIPSSLLESELFGYEKGAFTGAYNANKGLMEVASGGTIMFDEIGDMSPEMQAGLLRAVEEKEIRRVGGRKPIKIDVRIISASNKRLEDLVREGAFREDLFYRLNVLSLELPPLRKRAEDVPLLFEHIWNKTSDAPLQIKEDDYSMFMKALMDYDWPGNVRELENEVYRLVSLASTPLTLDSLSRNIREGGLSPGGRAGVLSLEHATLPGLEKKMIAEALDKSSGNKSGAARMLSIPRSTLVDKARKYGLL